MIVDYGLLAGNCPVSDGGLFIIMPTKPKLEIANAAEFSCC